MNFHTFFSPQMNTKVTVSDDCYYFMEGKYMTCLPFDWKGIHWEDAATYDPNVGASTDALTAECNQALSILKSEVSISN